MVPVFAAILAVLLLNESFHLFHLTALILVFAGIYLFEIKK
jgi:drug/metabolite transporter (DMT)-like permease